MSAPGVAAAGGLYVPGVGPIAVQRAGAFVATADDPSAIGVNPAGLAGVEGNVVLIGAAFLDYSLTYQRRGTYDDIPDQDLPWEGDPYGETSDQSKPTVGVGPFQALPMIAASFDLSKNVKGLHVGVGVMVPTSYPGRDVDSDYELDDPETPPPPGRYDIVTQDAAIVLPTVAVGYRVPGFDKLDLGARFAWGFATLEATTYTWGTTNYEEWTGRDAKFTLEAEDHFVPAYGFGALFHATDAIDIGLDWQSEINVHAKGTGVATSPSGVLINGMPIVIEPRDDEDAKCAPGGEVGKLKACIDIGLPMTTTLGARYKLRDDAGAVIGDVEFDVAYERWSAVSDHHVIVDGAALGVFPLNESDITHNFDDTFSFRLGGSYLAPVGAGLTVRGGVAHDTAAAPEGWERLDLDGAARTTAAFGVAYPFGKVAVTAGVGYVYEGSRDVGTDCNTNFSAPSCKEGNTQGQALDDRIGPDPVQPLSPSPDESPFNAGRYESSYLMLSLAALARF